jgi:hypothetical protein
MPTSGKCKVLGLLPPSKTDQGCQEIVDGKGSVSLQSYASTRPSWDDHLRDGWVEMSLCDGRDEQFVPSGILSCCRSISHAGHEVGNSTETLCFGALVWQLPRWRLSGLERSFFRHASAAWPRALQQARTQPATACRLPMTPWDWGSRQGAGRPHGELPKASMPRGLAVKARLAPSGSTGPACVMLGKRRSPGGKAWRP